VVVLAMVAQASESGTGLRPLRCCAAVPAGVELKLGRRLVLR
jgi:hypothetical protein